MIIDNISATRIIKTLGAAKAPPFLATVESGSRALRVHVCDRRYVKDLGEQLGAALEQGGEAVKVKITVHNRALLANPRSLEHWIGAFDGEQILFDPTQVHARATALVGAAREIRRELGDDARGCFFDPARRILFVLIKDDAKGPNPARMLTEIERRLRTAMAGADADTTAEFASGGTDIRIQTGSTMPVGSLVPVDRRSSGRQSLWRKVFSGKQILALSSGLLLASSLAHAGTARTVSAEAAINQFGVLGSLSVFRDGESTAVANAFAVVGLLRYFGDAEGATARGAPIVVAQGGPNDSGAGLRVVVTPEPQVEDRPDLRRPSWATPFTAGAGPGS